MLDLYYDTEKPLPADDFDRLAKRVGAKTDAEKAALKDVLAEFFDLQNGYYCHSRCAAEILIYQEKIEKASLAGKASALARAKQKGNKRSTPVKPVLDSGSTPTTYDLQPTTQLKALSGKPDDPPGFIKFWSTWPKSERKAGRGKCLALWKRKRFEANAVAVVAHVERMKVSQQWQEKSGEFIPAPMSYLNKEPWDGAELDAPVAGAKPWFLSQSAINAKADELGIDLYEPWVNFRDEVYRAAGVTPAMIKQAEADWK